jgi:hypothetical protein
MSPNEEANVSRLMRLWTRIIGMVKMLEGIDDPTGDYMLSLGKRVDKLERDLKRIEERLASRAEVGGKDLRTQFGLPA